MKFNVTVELEEYDNIYDLKDEIIHSVANQVFNELLYLNSDNLTNEIMDYAKNAIFKTTNTIDFKREVTETVTQKLVNSTERTKQYKKLVDSLSIEKDEKLTKELEVIVANVVTKELKKRFK